MSWACGSTGDKRYGERNRRSRAERCFERRRNNVCCSGMWSGCVLSKRKYRIIYGHSKKRRNHIGISTRNRTTCKKFSDAEPDYQWTGGMDTGDRGKRKERIFDHCRFCTGSGEGCLCTSGTGDKCVESGMSQTDPAGSGNTFFF